MPVVPTTGKAEAEESLQPELGVAVSEIAPLHSSLVSEPDSDSKIK